jgi:hypothetical protein
MLYLHVLPQFFSIQNPSCTSTQFPKTTKNLNFPAIKPTTHTHFTSLSKTPNFVGFELQNHITHSQKLCCYAFKDFREDKNAVFTPFSKTPNFLGFKVQKHRSHFQKLRC